MSISCDQNTKRNNYLNKQGMSEDGWRCLEGIIKAGENALLKKLKLTKAKKKLLLPIEK
jgi:hypothetical protein